MVEIRNEFEVSTRSRMFPESNRVGSLTVFVNPNSQIISMSLLCLAAVCELVEHILTQLISGRLKSPARMTDGGVLQLLQRIERDSCNASSDAV